jgi:hypothetical protein
VHRREFKQREERANPEVVVNYIDHRGACCLRQIPLTGLAALILNNANAPRKRDQQDAPEIQEGFRE